MRHKCICIPYAKPGSPSGHTHTHTRCLKQRTTSCLTTGKRTITVSGRQSDISNPCRIKNPLHYRHGRQGAGVWHKASVSDCLPLAAPIGLSPLLLLTLCGSERVLVVSTEPLHDLSCLTTPGVGCPGDGLSPVPLTRCIQMHTPSPCGVC